MNIQSEKLEIMKMVLEIENPRILESVKQLIKQELEIDFWEKFQQDRNDEILFGLDEIEKDDTEDFDEFIKKYGN